MCHFKEVQIFYFLTANKLFSDLLLMNAVIYRDAARKGGGEGLPLSLNFLSIISYAYIFRFKCLKFIINGRFREIGALLGEKK